MARTARYLADWSALARAPRYPAVNAVPAPLIENEEVAFCGAVLLESLLSARGYNELIAARFRLTQGMPAVSTTQPDFERATGVLMELARQNHHRAVGVMDLVIAAVAERAGLILLHYDSDYDYVAGVTGQPMEWVVPRGTVP